MVKKLLVFLIFFLLIPSIYGIGAGIFVREIQFSPNLNKNLEAFINNNVGSDIKVRLEARGGLAEYVTFSEEYADILAGGRYFFTFNLKLPESIPPGRNRIEIGATDVTPPPPGVAGIRAVTAAFIAFIVVAPYPGKYIEASFTAQDIELNETVTFNINIISRGNETINRIDGIIEIFYQGNKIDILTLDRITDIKPGESKTIQAKWDSKSQKIGEYNAKATINYDGQQTTIYTKFRIGTLLVKIINYTKEFYKDEINKFDIELNSFWNTKIDDVYGEIDVGKEKIKTLKTDLAPWAKTKITAHLDTHNLDLGEHIADIKVYYADKVAQEFGKITILPKREKIIEMPSKIQSTTILLISIITLLVIGNIILVLYFIRTKKSQNKDSPPLKFNDFDKIKK